MENERYKRFEAGSSTVEITQVLFQNKVEIDVWEHERSLLMDAEEAIKMALNILEVCNYKGDN